ncbi:MAG TPA: Crp/Fnr family transcriptional regulator, partial [Clostridiales bacterium]|nr:Crp/Fnr family transcriptional regulator [Clostridiales bacterium]
MLRENDYVFMVEHLDFWDNLSDNEKNLVKNNVTKVTYNKGEILYSADNECLGLVLIQKGGLRVYILSED